MTSKFHDYLPVEGEIVYFVKPHLDTLELSGAHETRGDVQIFTLEGKARPMLILRLLPESDRGRRWFLVLPITSKGLNQDGKCKQNMEPIGRCLDPAKDSFVEIDGLAKLPENMISRLSDGAIKRVRPCDRHAISNAQKVVEYKIRRYGRTALEV